MTLSAGVWDTHSALFTYQRDYLPRLDQSLHALVTDLSERGLDQHVAVVVCGEMGRTPRINKTAGRDHWPSAGFAVFAGGGLRMGQVVGATDAIGERPKDRAYNPQNILATLYHVLSPSPLRGRSNGTCHAIRVVFLDRYFVEPLRRTHLF